MEHFRTRMARTEVSEICELLFRTAAEGLVVVDGSGIIMLLNPRMHELFGYAADELEGSPIEVLIPDAARNRHRTQRSAYQSHPEKRPMGIGRELFGRRKDGSVFPVEVSLNHFELDGQRYVMGLVSDVTLRKQAEDELYRMNAELEQRVADRTRELEAASQSVAEALEKERELNALKSRFLSMASHEFRTPLATIMGSVDLIARYAEGPATDKVERHVVRIRNKVRELTGILNDFLSLDKLEQGRTTVNPTPFDIVHLCIDLLEELRPMARPGQELMFDHEGGPSQLQQDRQMLSNVVRNLVTNAIKYSPEGAPIHLVTRCMDDVLHLEVRDRGMGIPAEDQEHLFERFFRAGNVVNVQGTGLGLNIVRKYLELMKGDIRFHSRVGEGTTFTVTLPAHLEPPSNPDEAPLA
ncbi:MAG: PAS domain-containing sensor histidine kinase [Flavobacteriales bacterium]|nr:PAS domain-containing sensor histidine kinase [Flavobacteriales bacterium]